MTYSIATISLKRFVTVAIIGAISLPVLFYYSIMLIPLDFVSCALFACIWLAAILNLGHYISTTNTVVRIKGGQTLDVNNKNIPITTITGYFFNDLGITQSALSLRLDSNKSIHIVSSKIGKTGQTFNQFRTKLIAALIELKPDLVELEYQDIHTKQMLFLRPAIILLIGAVISIDVVMIYRLVQEHRDIPWQAFIVNASLFYLFPYLKKRRKTNTHF